jgi:hypothetical protein
MTKIPLKLSGGQLNNIQDHTQIRESKKSLIALSLFVAHLKVRGFVARLLPYKSADMKFPHSLCKPRAK